MKSTLGTLRWGKPSWSSPLEGMSLLNQTKFSTSKFTWKRKCFWSVHRTANCNHACLVFNALFSTVEEGMVTYKCTGNHWTFLQSLKLDITLVKNAGKAHFLRFALWTVIWYRLKSVSHALLFTWCSGNKFQRWVNAFADFSNSVSSVYSRCAIDS